MTTTDDDATRLAERLSDDLRRLSALIEAAIRHGYPRVGLADALIAAAKAGDGSVAVWIAEALRSRRRPAPELRVVALRRPDSEVLEGTPALPAPALRSAWDVLATATAPTRSTRHGAPRWPATASSRRRRPRARAHGSASAGCSDRSTV